MLVRIIVQQPSNQVSLQKRTNASNPVPILVLSLIMIDYYCLALRGNMIQYCRKTWVSKETTENRMLGLMIWWSWLCLIILDGIDWFLVVRTTSWVKNTVLILLTHEWMRSHLLEYTIVDLLLGPRSRSYCSLQRQRNDRAGSTLWDDRCKSLQIVTFFKAAV